jgi:hypothetical protein
MTSLLDLLRALLLPIVVLAGAMSLALWWRSRFWAPIYIQLIAALSTLIASLLAWMAWIVDDPLKARALWLVVIFPALVYLTFGFYGGKIIRKHLLLRDKGEDG